MNGNRSALVLLGVAASFALYGAFDRATGNSLGHESRTPLTSALPTAAPPYDPGPNSLSGRVARRVSGGVIVEGDDREVAVDLGSAVDVWRERSVPASAIEVGDDVSLNGTAGSPFVARYVWANIGRIDGVIREIDATGMLVDVQRRDGPSVVKRIDFSAYIEYGASDGSVKVTRADLVVGRQIGAVVYQPRNAIPRATRIW